MFFILLLEFNRTVMEYGARQLFSIPSLCVYSGEKIGIVGENGAGKTTLMEIISGQTTPTAGSVKCYVKPAYITQRISDLPEPEESHEKYRWDVCPDPHSGGEITRAKIADALAQNSELLLCDEPTSSLDETGIIQLEKTLSHNKGAVLLVSHDRALMDKVCTAIWELQDGNLNVFSGNYSAYQEEKTRQRKNQQKEYEVYSADKRALEKALHDRSSKAQGMTKTPSRMGNSEARLHRMDVRQRAGKVSGAAKNIKSRLDNLEVKEKPRKETNYRLLAKQSSAKASKVAVRVEALSFSYGHQHILRDISFLVNRNEKVCIQGKNGCGKTTLLNCIANGYSGVSVSPSADIGYFSQSNLGLDESLCILEYVMLNSKLPEHTSRTILAELGIKRDAVYKKISLLSGGEKSKVALAELLCRQCAILILDEPTNYLDIYILEALENMLVAYDRTLIFVSHDRRFREKIATRFLTINAGQIEEPALEFTHQSSNRNAEILKLELEASRIIEIKKGVSDFEQAEYEAKYQELIGKINALKAVK